MPTNKEVLGVQEDDDESDHVQPRSTHQSRSPGLPSRRQLSQQAKTKKACMRQAQLDVANGVIANIHIRCSRSRSTIPRQQTKDSAVGARPQTSPQQTSPH